MKNITLSTALVFAFSCTTLFSQVLKPVKSGEPLAVCKAENKNSVQVKTAPPFKRSNVVYHQQRQAPALRQVADVEERTLTRNSPAKIKSVEMKAFPNPFTSNLSLIITDADLNSSSYEAQLYDLQGKKVFFQKLSSNQTVLMPPDINAGMYFLHVLKKGTVVLKEKMIKQ